MIRLVIAIAIATTAATATVTACGARPSVILRPAMPSAETVDSARAVVNALVKQQRIPGLAVTVSRGRTTLWHEGFGFADIELKIPASPDTRFRIGSVSKLLTATALMRIAQTGGVNLDAPASSYLDLPQAIRSPTLRQLAGHLGGIRHYRGSEFFSTEHYESLKDALGIFSSDTLLFAPGTRYSYSSYGFNLIGAALESALQLPFSDIVRRYVLEPLQMLSTVPDAANASLPNYARRYSVGDSTTTVVPLDDLSGRLPSGGYLSTTDDLARLGQATLASGLLSDNSLATMLTPQRLVSGEEIFVGIAWRISTDSTGRRYFHHGGTSNGGSAFLLVFPQEQIVVAMAANAYTQWGEREALAVARIFAGSSPAISSNSHVPRSAASGATTR